MGSCGMDGQLGRARISLRALLNVEGATTKNRRIAKSRSTELNIGPAKMMKQISIIVAAMALIVASSTAMAESQERAVEKATHRAKSPRPPSYEDKLRQYEEDKRKGWYKIDKA
jgi:hypothetical protein